MSKMKKALIGGLAVGLVLILTACSAKCAFCGKKIEGSGTKQDGKTYCNQICALGGKITK